MAKSRKEMEIRDRMQQPELVEITSRFDPTPEPYMLHIRERFNDDGSVETIHRKRVYNDRIVDEEL